MWFSYILVTIIILYSIYILYRVMRRKLKGDCRRLKQVEIKEKEYNEEKD